MRARVLVAAAGAALVVLALASAGSTVPPPENAVTHWSRITEQTVSVGRPPASSQVLAGIVYAAIYDAVAATEGGLEPFLASPSAADGASSSAAIATAARDVLVARLPAAQDATVESAYGAFMLGIPNSQAKTDGVAAGAAVATAILAIRANDNFDNVVPYVQPTPDPGVFEQIGPPAPVQPVDVKLKQVVPYTFASPSDFRPGPPASLKSGEYAASFAEVKAYGGTDAGTSRTQAQTDTARYWTEQAHVQWSRTLRELANSRALDLRDSARLLALVHVAAADTMIACWEAKYYYVFWRPFHAIRRADTDDNKKTEKDEAWQHLITGNHPEYPSGHGCITGAYTEALQTFFHTDRVALAIESTVFPVGDSRRTRSYERLGDVREDVTNARVWGGLHFRSTMEETHKLPDKVVSHVAAHFFREAPGQRRVSLSAGRSRPARGGRRRPASRPPCRTRCARRGAPCSSAARGS